jgi:D-alanyl-D-alanine carboxypeptidase
MASAYDISRLIAFSATDERIAPIMRKAEYTVTTSRRTVKIHSTNRMLGQVDVQGGKTGFIRNSGYCFATLLRLPQGKDIAVVVLGAKSSTARWIETRHLFNWMSDKAKALIGQPEGQ